MNANLAVVYESSPIKSRRTKAELQAIRAALYQILAETHPMTVRQVFYQMVSRGEIAKTEGEYKATIVRLLTVMRKAGEIPYNWIADNTRWMRKEPSYGSLEDALRRTRETYRRSIWSEQSAYVEVWLEKDALAGVLYEETNPWDVTLMVTRGYSSVSYLWGAAEVIKAHNKPAYIYYFGDHDPSGQDISRVVERELRTMAQGVKIHFERVAVTPEQIRRWDLPTRPTKKTDSRSKGFQGESVEVDAIPPQLLRQLTRACIERHIDRQALAAVYAIEAEERKVLDYVLHWWQESPNTQEDP